MKNGRESETVKQGGGRPRDEQEEAGRGVEENRERRQKEAFACRAVKSHESFAGGHEKPKWKAAERAHTVFTKQSQPQ